MWRTAAAVVALWTGLAAAQSTCPRWGMDGAQGADDTAGTLELWENCATFDTNNTGRINLHGRIKLADTWTFGNAAATTYIVEVGPAVTITAANQNVSAFVADGTMTQTVAPATGAVNAVDVKQTVQSGTNAVKPPITRGVLSEMTLAGVDCGGGACALGSTAQFHGFETDGVVSVTGGSTSLTVTNVDAFRDNPAFLANTAGSSLTIATRRGVHIMDPGANSVATGTLAVTTNTAVEIDAQTIGTTVYGLRVRAQATGTNIFPAAFGEAAITGTAVASEGSVGVESGAPNRFFFKNESGHIWRTGYMDLQSNCTTLNTLVASSPFYCPTLGTVAANATEATAQTLGPGGDIHVFAMTVVISAAPGSGVTRTFTLRDDGGDATGLNCAITGTTATQCSVRVETNTSQGTAVASPSLLAVKEAVSGGTAAAARAAISLVYLLDTW